MWIKARDGSYANLDQVSFIRLEGSEPNVRIGFAFMNNVDVTGTAGQVDALYATTAEAEEAMHRLVQGVDIADVV